MCHKITTLYSLWAIIAESCGSSCLVMRAVGDELQRAKVSIVTYQYHSSVPNAGTQGPAVAAPEGLMKA